MRTVRTGRDHPVVIVAPLVVTGRHRQRLELDVAHCPGCGRRHLHRAGLAFVEGDRTAPCGQRYVLRAAVPRQVAA